MRHFFISLALLFLSSLQMAVGAEGKAEDLARDFLNNNAPELVVFFGYGADTLYAAAEEETERRENIYRSFGEMFLFAHVCPRRTLQDYDDFEPVASDFDGMAQHLRGYFMSHLIDIIDDCETEEKKMIHIGRFGLILQEYRPAYKCPAASIRREPVEVKVVNEVEKRVPSEGGTA